MLAFVTLKNGDGWSGSHHFIDFCYVQNDFRVYSRDTKVNFCGLKSSNINLEFHIQITLYLTKQLHEKNFFIILWWALSNVLLINQVCFHTLTFFAAMTFWFVTGPLWFVQLCVQVYVCAGGGRHYIKDHLSWLTTIIVEDRWVLANQKEVREQRATL